MTKVYLAENMEMIFNRLVNKVTKESIDRFSATNIAVTGEGDTPKRLNLNV